MNDDGGSSTRSPALAGGSRARLRSTGAPAEFELGASELLASAASWRLASLLLERPRPEWKIEIARLAAEVSDARLPALAADAAQATEECYHRLFGPAGAVSPREVSYCGFEDPGRLIAELSAFYHAFSFSPRREESIDHVSVEAGFVGYLFLKEAYARMRKAAASATITREAREQFLSEHFARTTRGMRERSVHMPAYLQRVLSWLNDGIEADGRPPDASVIFHDPTGPLGR